MLDFINDKFKQIDKLDLQIKRDLAGLVSFIKQKRKNWEKKGQ